MANDPESIFDFPVLRRHINQKRYLSTPAKSLALAAQEIGITAQTLQLIASGKVKPNIESFGKIVRWLETDPNDYFNF